MTQNSLVQKMKLFFDEVEKLLPEFFQDPVDYAICKGNIAVCVIDAEGNTYGRLVGDNKAMQRDAFLTASKKAIQVWSTGYPTGVYEELVYTRKVNWWNYGINKPDFIGWEGGLPVVLEDNTKLAVAFSGFRGEIDCVILKRALEVIQGSVDYPS